MQFEVTYLHWFVVYEFLYILSILQAMKKSGIVIFMLLASVFSIAFAKDFDLWSVDLNFCNAQNQLHIQANAGAQTGFCMMFNNISNTTGMIKVAIVDGEMSVGENPVKACKTTTEGYFPKFATFSGMATGNIIVLPPNTGIVQRWTVDVPTGFIGMLNGCITYVMYSSGSEASGMFQIVNRKANIIDVVVSGAYVNKFGFMNMKTFSGEDWKLDPSKIVLSDTTPILITQVQDKNTLVIGLQNTGFIDENYVISWTVYNSLFGRKVYNKIFTIGSGSLYGQDKIVIEHLLDELPFYKGQYYISVDVSHTPVVISGMVLDTKPVNMPQTLSIMVYPDMYTIMVIVGLIVLVCCIIVLVTILKKSQKKKA